MEVLGPREYTDLTRPGKDKEQSLILTAKQFEARKYVLKFLFPSFRSFCQASKILYFEAREYPAFISCHLPHWVNPRTLPSDRVPAKYNINTKVWKSAVPVISSQGHASGVVHQFAKRPSSQVQVDQWQNGAKYKWQLLFLHMAGNSLNLPQEYHFS